MVLKTKEFYHLISRIVPQSISSTARILTVYKSTLAVFFLECMQGSGCLHTLFCQCAWNQKQNILKTMFESYLNAVTIIPGKVQIVICILGCWPVMLQNLTYVDELLSISIQCSSRSWSLFETHSPQQNRVHMNNYMSTCILYLSNAGSTCVILY